MNERKIDVFTELELLKRKSDSGSTSDRTMHMIERVGIELASISRKGARAYAVPATLSTEYDKFMPPSPTQSESESEEEERARPIGKRAWSQKHVWGAGKVAVASTMTDDAENRTEWEIMDTLAVLDRYRAELERAGDIANVATRKMRRRLRDIRHD